jgi:hypothetical protein
MRPTSRPALRSGAQREKNLVVNEPAEAFERRLGGCAWNGLSLPAPAGPSDPQRTP